MAFKEGDIVQLKSGGPKMTVTRVQQVLDDTVVNTSWFSGSKLEHGGFTPNAIQLYKDEEKKK